LEVIMNATRSSIFSLSFAVLLIAFVIAGPALQTGAQSGTPAAPAPTQSALPPAQAATGPGGAEFSYDGIRAQHYGPPPNGNSDPTGYWLFEPTGPHPDAAAGPLPLVLFLHGFDISGPEWYHAWIDHLVRRGAILIYPDYQTDNLPFDDLMVATVDKTAPQAIQSAVGAALTELAGAGHAQPDLKRFVVIGHSLGAVLAADYAGLHSPGLPMPSALFLVMPGCAAYCDFTRLAAIPAATRVLVLVGNQDTLAGEDTAKQIWAQLTQVTADRKDYIRLMGDDHGQPAIVADHFVPVTTSVTFFGLSVGALNALDWYGTWKWADALMSCGFAGKDCQYALGDTPEQRFMGAWSDGTPVTEAQVESDPNTVATPSS
jgi:acetyl esterase/lipase